MKLCNCLKLVLLLALLQQLFSAKLANVPTELVQPDGSKMSAFFSGDEFYHYCHDAAGNQIVQADDGWFVNSNKSRAPISGQEYTKRKNEWQSGAATIKAPHTGLINSLSIFIRFSNQTEFATPRSTFDPKFNSTTAASLKTYYREVSYNQLEINTHFFPGCDLSTNVSYADSHPRGYYSPYSGSNTIGYQSVREARLREHTLIKNAVESIASQAGGIDFDGDDDGFVDNLCIITRGDVNGWADVGLWPHTGVADSYDIRINGARIFNYELQFENRIEYRVLCHEMFHILGAPDLYHYTDNPISSVGQWDIMESGGGHMGAYMKYRFANQAWISGIPEITQSGTYSLKPLYRSENNCYKIASPYTDKEYFVLEYRKKSGLFENGLPGSGLLVYRINPTGDNAYSPPDMAYIFRPGGTPNDGGNVSSAFFSQNSGRTAINDINTDPKSFLTDGSAGGLFINNIGSADSTISFDVQIPGCNITTPADSLIHAANSTIPVNISAISKGFTKVELYLNNNLLTTLFNAPYTYNLQIAEAGAYSLTAKAFSHTGITAIDSRTLFISNNQPYGFFVTPTVNQLFAAGEQISLKLKAGWPAHVLTKAEIYLDNQLVSTLNQEPYNLLLTAPATTGTHQIKAKFFAGEIFGEAVTSIQVGQFLLQESFEGSWPPAGWSVNTPVYGWYRTDKAAKSGNYAAAVRHYHTQGPAILESPQINLTGGEKMEFYWMDRDADVTKVIGLDSTYLEIYADSQWQLLKVNSAENIQPTFVKEEIDLNAFSGKTVKFRWRDITDETIYTQGCVLDDIRIGKGFTGINESNHRPEKISISNYPNPFNPTTRISYTLPIANNVKLSIYNVRGELVKTLINSRQMAGEHSVVFDGAALNSGVYFYKLETKEQSITGRMMFIK